MTNNFIFSIEMNAPILDKILAHVRSFENICFFLHSKHDYFVSSKGAKESDTLLQTRMPDSLLRFHSCKKSLELRGHQKFTPR